jgi:DNA polymerase III subunit epsilon
MKNRLSPKIISSLPDAPGVYLFYGPLEELLYVGKSRSIRTRVRSHFSAREERWLCRKVCRVEARETAGELGALLLESKLIKELGPMFNVASRRRRRIIIARRSMNAGGYTVVNLEAIDYLDVEHAGPILGVFKHTTQAKEYLASIAKLHRLCPKLLRLEVARGYCFSYHLGQCDGACMNEEDPAAYNDRVDRAFEERRIKAWPYKSGIVIEEASANETLRESFLIDNWCLVGGFRSSGDTVERTIEAHHRFDYDSYKILYAYMTDQQNEHRIRTVTRREFEKMRRPGPKK